MMENHEGERNVAGGRGVSGLLLFGLAGALFWGMRGAPGYGGISGAVIPGLVWGLIWYNLARGAGATPSAVVVLACVLGFGLGGYNGYGQYISWISGKFHINYPETWVAISPWKGYLYLFITGAGWGGLGGVMLSWLCGDEERFELRMVRIAILPLGFFLGRAAVLNYPGLFMPFYGAIPYTAEKCPDCLRTFDTTVGMVSFVSMTLAALGFEAARGNFRSMHIILIAALGFGAAFAGCAPFHYLGSAWPVFDWWKAWEMSLGFIGGATIWFLNYIYSPFNLTYDPHSWHENKYTKIILVDSPVFIVLIWAFINCSQVHWGGGPEDLDFVVGVLFIPACIYAVFRQRPFRDYRAALVFGGVLPKDRLIFPLVSLSAMSLIVIWPNFRVLAVFTILAAAAVIIHLRMKITVM